MFRITRLFAVLLLIAALAPAAAQLHTFDLDQLTATNLLPATRTVCRGVGLALGHHPVYDNDSNRRLHLGGSFSYPCAGDPPAAALSGGVPVIEGSYLITANLFLNGKLCGYNAGDDLVLISAYGATLLLEKPDHEQGWRLDCNLSQLQGPADLRLRQTDLLLQRAWALWFLPLQVGAGVNFYSARVSSDDDPTFAQRLQGQTNYLYLAGTFALRDLCHCGLHLRLHPKIATVTFDIIKDFN